MRDEEAMAIAGEYKRKDEDDFLSCTVSKRVERRPGLG